MKKISILIVILLMSFGLIACGGKGHRLSRYFDLDDYQIIWDGCFRYIHFDSFFEGPGRPSLVVTFKAFRTMGSSAPSIELEDFGVSEVTSFRLSAYSTQPSWWPEDGRPFRIQITLDFEAECPYGCLFGSGFNTLCEGSRMNINAEVFYRIIRQLEALPFIHRVIPTTVFPIWGF